MEKVRMTAQDTDQQFFRLLIDSDTEGLERILAEDFVLIDVMSGGVISKAMLLSIIGPDRLQFEKIESAETLIRVYGDAAVVTGRTQMAGRVGEAPFSADSRYTHVYIDEQGQWRLVAAQGTKVMPQPEECPAPVAAESL